MRRITVYGKIYEIKKVVAGGEWLGKTITPFFNADEFACKKCLDKGIYYLKFDMTLIQHVHFIREAVNHPLMVVSGTRCEKHNKECGGSKSSYHLVGGAADIMSNKVTYKKIYLTAEKLNHVGGIGTYPDDNPQFVHIDVRESEVHRWVRKLINGKKQYFYVI